jgi:transposase
MESKKRRHFPDAFKREAVNRARTSGLTIIEVAEELGLHETVLRRWIRRFDPLETGPARRPIPQVQGLSPADLAAENARLKRDLQKAEMERDILKKAALIFGKGAR